MDVSSMTDEELTDLGRQVQDEQSSRRCQEWLPGHQSCDRGALPHDEHGYDGWGRHKPGGQERVRVTWRTLPE